MTTYQASDFIKCTPRNLTAVAQPTQTTTVQRSTPTTIRVPAKSITKTQAVEAVVQDGTYTLVYKDSTYFTFKITTATKGALKDKRIVSYLSGPDNTTDFQGFAFLNPDGTVKVWARYQNGPLIVKAEHLNILFTMPARLEKSGLDYAVISGRCRRCNHKLTVPASVARGFGPECVKKATGFNFG